jgi:hypothetical protein
VHHAVAKGAAGAKDVEIGAKALVGTKESGANRLQSALWGPECATDSAMFRRFFLAASLCSLLVACDPNAGKIDQASVTFDGSKQLILVAQYTPNAQSNGIGAFADVPVGTTGTLEMTGPMHMHCDGTFQAQTAGGMPDFTGNRPGLDLGSGARGITFAAPQGEYTVVVSIPSKTVQVKKTFSAGTSYIDPITNVWDLSTGCVQIADTRQQLEDLTMRRVQAVETWVGRADASPLKVKLLPLATKAYASLVAGDKATAIQAMTVIRDTVQPSIAQNPWYDIYRDSRVALALLTQPVPAT